jgi:hypothetical protein
MAARKKLSKSRCKLTYNDDDGDDGDDDDDDDDEEDKDKESEETAVVHNVIAPEQLEKNSSSSSPVLKTTMKKTRTASWRKRSAHLDKTVTTPGRFWQKPTQAVTSPPPPSKQSWRFANCAPMDLTCQNATGSTKHSVQWPPTLLGSLRQKMCLSFRLR